MFFSCHTFFRFFFRPLTHSQRTHQFYYFFILTTVSNWKLPWWFVKNIFFMKSSQTVSEEMGEKKWKRVKNERWRKKRRIFSDISIKGAPRILWFLCTLHFNKVFVPFCLRARGFKLEFIYYRLFNCFFLTIIFLCINLPYKNTSTCSVIRITFFHLEKVILS